MGSLEEWNENYSSDIDWNENSIIGNEDNQIDDDNEFPA